MEPHWDPSLVCTLFIFCPWCPYYSQTAKVSQHQKDGGRRRGEIRSRPQWTLPQGRGLINNLHISKMQRIKSNMSCFFFFFFFCKTTGPPRLIEKHLTSNQRARVCSFEITCHFHSLFLKHISSLLRPPAPPHSSSLSLARSLSSLSVWTLHRAQVLCYCTPLHACIVWLRAHS